MPSISTVADSALGSQTSHIIYTAGISIPPSDESDDESDYHKTDKEI